MSSHNPQGRRRRTSSSSSNSDQSKRSGANRRDGNTSRPWKRDSAETGKRNPRPRSKSKFGSTSEPGRGGEQKSSFERRAKNKGESFGRTRRDESEKRAPKGTRNEKRPFKASKTESPSAGLRRERPYKKSGESSKSSGDRKTYGAKTARARKSLETDKIQPDLKAPAQIEKIRLNRFIANSGVCSRREADELIKMGLISVNGKVITEMGYKVNPGDEVRHESKVLKAERPVYILLNKPKGFLTTTSDPQERNTVMHLIGNKVKERVYPVGRLDRNTTGLLLLTNDGELADKLMHPSYNVKKIYKVDLDKPLTKSDAQLILDGVQLDEGKAIVDDVAIISDDKRTVGLEIHIGWNRVVRRIFEALGYAVLKLDRSVYAGLDKKNLGRGEWRFLTKEELVRLKHY